MPSELPGTADIVIIGGGVMGASTAYHLALRRAGDVLLLERNAFFGQEATGRCAGGVRYQFATQVNVRLSMASLPMLERLGDETGTDCNFRRCGYLFALTTDDDLAAFRRNVRMQNALGVQTEWLDGDEVRRRLPRMRFPDALGGTFHALDGLADPNSVVMGYIQRARQLGVRARTEVEVAAIETGAGRVQAVHTSAGRIACRHVVNAAGPWLALVGAMAGVDIPVTPVRRQMVTTTPLPELPADFPFVIDFAQSLYFHREGDGLLTGMSNPNQAPGLDQNIDEAWELIALERAAARMPMLERAGRLSGWAGLYEVTPDAHPIFGATPVEGFWVVGGFSGHGFMHGPVAGQLMAEFILDGRAQTVDVSSLDLARFAENRLIHEYNVV
ncbi:MAG: FAD dependent oxidoreductase [Chloroflexi bacterium RBG_13_68_17]|nr:MAG: FAD dependent oxidoreductase [Chloroflexi bacterium RBG_13_68_17]